MSLPNRNLRVRLEVWAVLSLATLALVWYARPQWGFARAFLAALVRDLSPGLAAWLARLIP